VADARVSLSFVAGILLPGYLILRFVRLRFEPDALELLPLCFAAGLVLQAFWCLAMMNAGGSTRLTARLQTLLTVALLVAAARSAGWGVERLAGRGPARPGRDRRPAAPAARRAARRVRLPALAGRPVRRERGDGHRPQAVREREPHLPQRDAPSRRATTYLYPVHMFVQAVLAHLSHVDVLLAHVKLRTLLVVLGLLIQYALMKGLTGRSRRRRRMRSPCSGWPRGTRTRGATRSASWSRSTTASAWRLDPRPAALYLMLLLYRGVRSVGLGLLWVAFLFAAALVHAKEALQILMIGVGLLVISALLRARAVGSSSPWPRRPGGGRGARVYSRHTRGASRTCRTSPVRSSRWRARSSQGWTRSRRGPGPAGRDAPLRHRGGEYDVGSFGFVVPTLLQHTAGFDFRLSLLLLPSCRFCAGAGRPSSSSRRSSFRCSSCARRCCT